MFQLQPFTCCYLLTKTFNFVLLECYSIYLALQKYDQCLAIPYGLLLTSFTTTFQEENLILFFTFWQKVSFGIPAFNTLLNISVLQPLTAIFCILWPIHWILYFNCATVFKLICKNTVSVDSGDFLFQYGHDGMMGAEESRSSASSGSPSYASGSVDFPNSCRRGSEATAWTLLHQCTLEKWKEGHAGMYFIFNNILLFANDPVSEYPWDVEQRHTCINFIFYYLRMTRCPCLKIIWWVYIYISRFSVIWTIS